VIETFAESAERADTNDADNHEDARCFANVMYAGGQVYANTAPDIIAITQRLSVPVP
jgi:hypothetical protein